LHAGTVTGIVRGVAHRLEITLNEELLAELDEQRGEEPRATFVKRALGAMLGSREPADTGSDHDQSSVVIGPARAPASPRPSAKRAATRKALDARALAAERQARLNKAKGM
jgi:hypothetical protein